jgi:bifunctional non-homologous end joining protein LigD
MFPTKFVVVSGAERRPGRIYIDYLRNARGATAIASYSTRARPGATVAMPLSWAEVESRVEPAAFQVISVPRMLSSRDDPWRAFTRSAGRLPV